MKENSLTSGVVLLQRINDGKMAQVRSLRKKQTPAEYKLWQHLRRNLIAGLKFRRQQVIEGFIVDFFCHQAKLIIEVDGEVHNTEEQHEIDIHRRAVFEARGLVELRFTNDEIFKDITTVVRQITDLTKKRTSIN